MQAANIILDMAPQLQKSLQKSPAPDSNHDSSTFLDQVKKELNTEEKPSELKTSASDRKEVSEQKQTAKETKAESSELKPEKSGSEKKKDTAEKKEISFSPKVILQTSEQMLKMPVKVSYADTDPNRIQFSIRQSTVKQIKQPLTVSLKNGRNVQTDGKQKISDQLILPGQLSWLKNADGKAGVKDSIDNLIDAAEKYVPGNEASEKIKLEKAQNLSVNDPALFLQQTAAKAVSADTGKLKVSDKTEIDRKSAKTGKSISFDITDLRTKVPEEEAPKVKAAVKSDLAASVKYDGQNTAQMTLTLSDQVQQNILSANDQTASAAGSDFQAMLANQIQNNSTEFVRAGSIVLKDNNVGNINLVLHPESLGNVKINLQLTDKVIAGHITVASREAFNAFQESIGSLKEAFTQNGFDSASFDLSWSGQQSSNSGYGSNEKNEAEMQFRSSRLYGDYASADGAVTAAAAPASAGTGDYRVNIVA